MLARFLFKAMQEAAADRYARKCAARYLREAQEERERADYYARACASWAAENPGAPVRAGREEIGAPGAVQAQGPSLPGAVQSAWDYQRTRGSPPPAPGTDPDPSRSSTYSPPFAAEVRLAKPR